MSNKTYKTSFGGVFPLLAATAIGFAVAASAAEQAKSSPEHPSPAANKSMKELQEEFLKLKFGMFLHYNMATYTGDREGASFFSRLAACWIREASVATAVPVRTCWSTASPV